MFVSTREWRSNRANSGTTAVKRPASVRMLLLAITDVTTSKSYVNILLTFTRNTIFFHPDMNGKVNWVLKTVIETNIS